MIKRNIIRKIFNLPYTEKEFSDMEKISIGEIANALSHKEATDKIKNILDSDETNLNKLLQTWKIIEKHFNVIPEETISKPK